jgi:hypothetical protein
VRPRADPVAPRHPALRPMFPLPCWASHPRSVNNRWQRRTRKSWSEKVVCVRSGEEVGAGFERREGGSESNPPHSGALGGGAQHTQNRPEPRVVSRTSHTKTPNRERLGAEVWWWNTEPNPRPLPDPDSNALALRVWIRRFGYVEIGRQYAVVPHAPFPLRRSKFGFGSGLVCITTLWENLQDLAIRIQRLHRSGNGRA